MKSSQYGVANQHHHDQHEKWTDREMPACEKNVANHVIVVRHDETFPGRNFHRAKPFRKCWERMGDMLIYDNAQLLYRRDAFEGYRWLKATRVSSRQNVALFQIEEVLNYGINSIWKTDPSEGIGVLNIVRNHDSYDLIVF